MSELEDTQHTNIPERVPRRRFQRARDTAIKYKRLFFGSTALAALLTVALLVFVFTDEPDRVPLGVGQAGVADSVAIDDTLAAAAEPEADDEDGRALPEGEASYYGDEFAGRPTASGEQFDPGRLTAAHRTLPFGTRLRVTNVQNDRSVVVRVNDRGPFTGNRVLDLSYSAARQIGLLQRGAGQVRMVVLE